MGALHFVTAIPQNFRQGSGCYVGTRTLAEGLRRLGIEVAMITPSIPIPLYTARRVLFNESLRWRRFEGDATIGIDADGYSMAGKHKRPPHVACIKGVLGDAIRFESGATRASMAFQAHLEAKHAQRADTVITISRYCAGRLEELYRVRNATVVPELIDLEFWRNLFGSNPASPDPAGFSVLCVCRFYPRKRVDVLLRAAARLRNTIPGLQIRIVGDGPEKRRLGAICKELGIESMVSWLGDLPPGRLAEEYNRAHVFCLPSIQEGFGIVFLEAMAAGKPIVAARTAAVPEVVGNGILVQPEDPDELAEALLELYRNPNLRNSLGLAAQADVEQYDVNRVARKFVAELARVAPQIQIPIEKTRCDTARNIR